MILESNAKINLGLSIIERRPDNFHNIESLFIPIPWYDEIKIVETEKTHFETEGIKIDGDLNDNLCMKAYSMLQKKYNLPPVDIILKKQIPIGAGLGGGSSNAAFVLKGLSKLYNLNISENILEEMADKLGSDCAFFIKNKTAFVSGKGEIIDTDISFSLDTHCIVVNPNIHISTQEAYSKIKPCIPKIRLLDAIKQPISQWKYSIINDFEESIISNYPLLKKLKIDLYKMGAIYVSMSGSGSSFFAFFNSKPNKNLIDKSFTYKSFLLNV